MSARSIGSLSDAGPMVATIFVRRGMRSTLAVRPAPTRFLTDDSQLSQNCHVARAPARRHLRCKWPIALDVMTRWPTCRSFVAVVVVTGVDAELGQACQQPIAHRV